MRLVVCMSTEWPCEFGELVRCLIIGWRHTLSNGTHFFDIDNNYTVHLSRSMGIKNVRVRDSLHQT